MTFFGLKLFAKVYQINRDKKKSVENIIFTFLTLPMAMISAGNYYYVHYSSILTHFIVIYLFIILNYFSKEFNNVSLSLVGLYVYGVRLFDLFGVAVSMEISRVSREVDVNIIQFGWPRVVFLIILSVLYYGIYYGINVRERTYISVETRFYRRILCIYSLIGNFCFSIVYIPEHNKKLINYWSFYLICAFFIIGMFLIYFLKLKNKERENMLNIRNNMMESNYLGLMKVYHENRTLQHDYKNHLLAISQLIKDNKNNDALQYINSYFNYNDNISRYIKSGNQIVDIVVNSKIKEAKEKCIEFEYDIEDLKDIVMDDIDLCALLANLLDNSIEACEKIKDDYSKINLKIVKRNSILIIHLENSVYKEITKKYKIFKTDKENSQLHGWGMKSIRSVVDKYDGKIHYSIKNRQIEFFITIPI